MKDKYLNKKCLEFFEIIEQDRCMVSKTDTRTFKNGSYINYFWYVNKEYCYNKICELKDKYPITYDILRNVYKCGYRYMTFEDKLNWYSRKVEELGQIIDENSNLKFDDGSSIYTFFKYYHNEIEKYLLDNKEKYPKAYLIIIPYLDSQKVFKRKCQIFFSIIESSNKMIDSLCTQSFDDGSKMKYFWYKNYEILYKMVNTDIYRNLYPVACGIINQCYDKKVKRKNNKKYRLEKKVIKPIKIKMSFEEKSDIVIDFMEKKNRLLNNNDKEKFLDNTKYFGYWVNNRNKIKNYFKLVKDIKLYPNVNLLFNRVSKPKELKLLPFSRKIQELIALLDSRKEKIYINKQDKFSDGTNVYGFWCYYKDVIKKSTVYFDGVDERVIDFIQTKNSLNSKIDEYILLVELNKSLLTNDKNMRFSDGTMVFSFWNNYKEKIVLRFCNNEVREKYPNATKIVQSHFYKKAFLKIKLNEYLSLVEVFENLLTNSNITFDDEVKVKTFMRYHKDYILNEIESDDYKEKYPNAYEIIKNKQKVKKL